MVNKHLLSLLHLSDPTLPIGGFSHSAGLETYVQEGIVKNRETAQDFISNMLSYNLRFTDAAFVSLAYDAASANYMDTIFKLDDECTAIKLPKEMRLASQKLGIRLLKIFSELIDHPLLSSYKRAIEANQISGHYCIAFGLLAYTLNIPKRETLQSFYYNAAVGMASNSVKLVPLGQMDGQKILFALQELVIELSEASLHPDKDLLGVCCSAFDIRSMQHERLYSRLYMS